MMKLATRTATAIIANAVGLLPATLLLATLLLATLLLSALVMILLSPANAQTDALRSGSDPMTLLTGGEWRVEDVGGNHQNGPRRGLDDP